MAAFPPRDRDAFMRHWRKILADEAVITETVLVDGRVAGNVVSWEHDGERDVGYWIGKQFWGKGVATAALSEFLIQVTTRPLHAHVARHNVASVRVLEKLGMQKEAHLRSHVIRRGERCDRVWYGILREGWLSPPQH